MSVMGLPTTSHHITVFELKTAFIKVRYKGQGNVRECQVNVR